MPTLLQCSYMPGDSFAIAAWLAIDQTAKLVYLRDDTLSDTKSTFILGLYNQTKVDKKVTIIELEKLWKGKLQESPCKAIYRLWSEKKIPGNPTLYADQDKTKEQVIRAALQQIWDNSGRQWPRAVTAVTGWLADQVKHSRDNKLTELLNRWGVAALTQQWAKDFDQFLAAKNMAQLQKQSLVLWSRQSGKTGGAHIELDSSYQGIRELVNGFLTIGKLDGKSIILAGDERLKGLALKLEKIAKDCGTLYLGEFWKSDEWKEKFSENRIAQLAFWVYLNGKKTKLTHLGMRSGNLELMSLLQMTVLYLEPKKSKSGERMTAFAKSGIDYQRIQIAHSPGLTAQWGEDLEQGQYDTTVRAATKGIWEAEQGKRQKQLRANEIKEINEEIKTVKKEKQEAFDAKKYALTGQLKREQQNLEKEKQQIYSKDYSKVAKDQLKYQVPKSQTAAQRTRGFDPTDVGNIVTQVCSRMK